MSDLADSRQDKKNKTHKSLHRDFSWLEIEQI